MPLISQERAFLTGLSTKSSGDSHKQKKSLKSPKNCQNCENRPKCQKICPEIEKQLPKMNTGRMGGKLTIVSPDIIQAQFYRSKMIGYRIMPVVYNDNLMVFDENT